MTEKFALVCGCKYSGGWLVYQSLNDAKKFYKILVEKYGYNPENIHTLYQEQYTKSNIIKELEWLLSNLDSSNKSGIVYVAGHGTQSGDRNNDELDGHDENWQTYDHSNVSDDEITAIFERSHVNSMLTIISDCCHSGSMLDRIDQNHSKYSDRNWVSVGSAMDNQSAIQSGDGSVCSYELFKILNEKPNIKIGELKKLLRDRMAESFIGSMQTAIINVSNPEMDNKHFIN